MKSKLFIINTNDPSICKTENGDNSRTKYYIKVPTLSAYAVEYMTVNLSGITTILDYSCISDDTLVIHAKDKTDLRCSDFLRRSDFKLFIHYNGIRKYSLLFPNVEQDQLKNRLGTFYQEAEVAFENSSWLSFMLMCGAIFEGILYSKIGKNLTFSQLIDRGVTQQIVNKDAAEIMNKVRKYRNIVHANKYNNAYVSREEAMDTMRLLNLIIQDA